MAKLVVVCKTSEDEAHKIAARLVSHRLNPVIFDSTSAGILQRYPDPVERIRVFVPAEEYDQAMRILAEIERDSEARAAPVVNRANGVFLLIVIALTFLVLVVVLMAVRGRPVP
jgi:hypothetical protein